MGCVAGFYPTFSHYGPTAVRVVPYDSLDIAFRNRRHCVHRPGSDMRGILSPLEEEGGFVPSRTPTRPHLW